MDTKGFNQKRSGLGTVPDDREEQRVRELREEQGVEEAAAFGEGEEARKARRAEAGREPDSNDARIAREQENKARGEDHPNRVVSQGQRTTGEPRTGAVDTKTDRIPAEPGDTAPAGETQVPNPDPSIVRPTEGERSSMDTDAEREARLKGRPEGQAGPQSGAMAGPVTGGPSAKPSTTPAPAGTPAPTGSGKAAAGVTAEETGGAKPGQKPAR